MAATRKEPRRGPGANPAPAHGNGNGKGLFRAVLAGPGHSLPDAFASMEQASNVERVYRHPKRDLLGARFMLPPDEGEGYWELTRVRDEIYVVIENFAYKDPRLELVPGDGLVQFNFKLSGDLTLGVSRAEPIKFNRPSLLVWNQPRGFDISEWTAPSAHEKCVCISVHPDYLRDNFVGSIVDAPPQLQAFLTGHPHQLKYCQLPLSAQMFELAMKLVSNPFGDATRLVYTEALSNELLCFAIESLRTVTSTPYEEYSSTELRSLHAARQLLMKQFAPPPTIRATSRAAGMNATTLKKGFKAIFGETLFEFGVRCRMQHALQLLRDQHMPVARVAEAVGYRHQTSFATAFARHFGMRPIDVRHAKRR